MNIKRFDDYNQLSAFGADLVTAELKAHPELLLCAATGGSPLGLYSNLQTQFDETPELFDRFNVIKLDEWVGLPVDDEGSCEYYLQKQLLRPLSVSTDRYISFDPHAKSIDEECASIQGKLQSAGSIDLCILGLGKNGHLGFNEPADQLQPYCHIATLTQASQQHDMVVDNTIRPTQGLTLGMADILSSRKIILIISGAGKEAATEFLLSKQVSTQCPASFLWLHDHVDCLIMN